MVDDFIIWAAGLFDGEGSITIKRPSYSLQVSIANSFKPALELFRQRFSGSLGLVKKAGEPISGSRYFSKVNSYQFVFTYEGARAFLTTALPYLRIKRAEAELALDYLSTIESLKSLRTGYGVAKKITGIERKARINFRARLRAIRQSPDLVTLNEPIVVPQLRLFSNN